MGRIKTADRIGQKKAIPKASRRQDLLKKLNFKSDFFRHKESSADDAVRIAQEASLYLTEEDILVNDRFRNTSKTLTDEIRAIKGFQSILMKPRKSGTYKTRFNTELRNKLLKSGSNIYVSDDGMNYQIDEVDYNLPCMLILEEVFHKFLPTKDTMQDEAKTISKRTTDSNVLTSPDRKLIVAKSSPESNTSGSNITVRMLKDNPEGHGLDKEVLELFSDKSEIIEVNIRGRKRAAKAFKQGDEILIHCTEKNCQHKAINLKDISICSNESPSLKKSKVDSLETNINESVDETTISEITESNKDDEECPTTSPKITHVQSLAPPILSTRLIPLASQLPNPVRKPVPPPIKTFTPSTRFLQLSHGPNPYGISMTQTSRPSILGKSGQNANNTAIPFIVLPAATDGASRRRSGAGVNWIPLPLVTPSSSKKAPRRIAPKIPYLQVESLSSVPALTESENMVVSPLLTGFELDELGETPPIIKNVFSKASLVVPSNDDSNPVDVDDTESERRSDFTSEDTRLSIEGNPRNHPDDDNSSETTVLNIATNIFEDADDEMDESEEIGIPQIVSTVGGINVGGLSSISNLSGLLSFEVNTAAAEDSETLQRRMILVSTPDTKILDGAEFLSCRLCHISFPADCSRLYLSHVKEVHNLEVKKLILPPKKAIATPLKVNNPPNCLIEPKVPEYVEWHHCKYCGQLLLEGETKQHQETCRPESDGEGGNQFVLEHIDMANVPKEVPMYCALCDKEFDSTVGLRQHLTNIHKDIAAKIILEPAFRCSSCLLKFQDSVTLTLHTNACNNRRASEETMLELAQSMIYCEMCRKSHDSIAETQKCYFKAGLIRCALCNHTVGSRGNFFHHINTYHFRGKVGIICPFCNMGEKAIRDCFVHMIDSHFRPILKLEKNNKNVPVTPVLPIRGKPVPLAPKPPASSHVVTQKGNPVMLVSSHSAPATLNGNAAITVTASQSPVPIKPAMAPQIIVPITRPPSTLSPTATSTSQITLPPLVKPRMPSNAIRVGIGRAPNPRLTRPTTQILVRNVTSAQLATAGIFRNGTPRTPIPGIRAVGVGNGSTTSPPIPIVSTPSTVRHVQLGPNQYLRPLSLATAVTKNIVRSMRPIAPAPTGVIRNVRQLRPIVLTNSPLGITTEQGQPVRIITPAQLQRLPGLIQPRGGPTIFTPVRLNLGSSNALQR